MEGLGKFDLILAGPPYYDVEDYNGVTVRSSFASWISDFVKPFSHRCWDCLVSGGIVALHVFDTHEYQFFEPFNEHMIRSGFRYRDQICYSKQKKAGRYQYVHVYEKRR